MENAMTDADDKARSIGFLDEAAHQEAHRLVYLPADHPEAPSKDARFRLKEALFWCHYGPGCSVTKEEAQQ
jgi:hypothetical protein